MMNSHSLIRILSVSFLVCSLTSCSTPRHPSGKELAAKSGKAERATASLSQHCRGVDENLSQPPFQLKTAYVLPDVPKKAAADLNKVVVTTQERLQGHLKYLEGLVLNVPWKEFDNAFFNPMSRSLNVPFQFVARDFVSRGGKSVKVKAKKHPKFTFPIVAHEYGHSVFDRNVKVHGCSMGQIISEIKAEQGKLEQEIKTELAKLEQPANQQKVETAQNLIARFTENFNEGIDLQYVEAVDAQNALGEVARSTSEVLAPASESSAAEKAVMKQIEELKQLMDENMRELTELTKIPSNAFGELFADAMATFIFAKDPNAVSDAMSFVKMEKPYNDQIRTRSFKTRKALSLKAPDKHDPKTVKFGEVDFYQSLNPLREHLWKRFLSDPEYRKRPGATMARLIDVFQTAVDDASKDPAAYAARPLLEVNDEMMKRLDEMMPAALNP